MPSTWTATKRVGVNPKRAAKYNRLLDAINEETTVVSKNLRLRRLIEVITHYVKGQKMSAAYGDRLILTISPNLTEGFDFREIVDNLFGAGLVDVDDIEDGTMNQVRATSIRGGIDAAETHTYVFKDRRPKPGD